MESQLYNFSLEFPFGINGENLLITIVNDRLGVVSSMTTDQCSVLSVGKLNETSSQFRDFYRTTIELSQLTSLEQCVLYAKYNGTLYKVGQVSKNMETMELYAREFSLLEDKSLGFVDDLNFRVTHKMVRKEEVEGLYCTRESILEKIQESQKKTK